MQHHGLKGAFPIRAICQQIVGGIGVRLKVLINFGGKAHWLLDVILRRGDRVDIRRRDDPQVGHARPVGADQHEQIASAGQLIAHFNQA